MALAIVSTVILLLGAAAGCIRTRLWISEPTICLFVGVLLGPAALDVINLADLPIGHPEFIENAARFTLAIAVMAAALRLPRRYMVQHSRDVAVVLAIGM